MDNSTCVILVPVAYHVEPECDRGLRELERRGYAVWRVPGYAAIDQARSQMATDALAAGFDELMLPVCNQRFGLPFVPYFLPMIVPDGDGHWYLGEDFAFFEQALRLRHPGRHDDPPRPHRQLRLQLGGRRQRVPPLRHVPFPSHAVSPQGRLLRGTRLPAPPRPERKTVRGVTGSLQSWPGGLPVCASSPLRS